MVVIMKSGQKAAKLNFMISYHYDEVDAIICRSPYGILNKFELVVLIRTFQKNVRIGHVWPSLDDKIVNGYQIFIDIYINKYFMSQ